MAKIGWNHLPVALPGGAMLPHLSARLRTATVDAVFMMTGGPERLADWANKPENYGDFITKVWAKGMAKSVSAELTADTQSLEGLLAQIDAGEHAKVVSPDGQPADPFDGVTIDDLVSEDG